MLTALEVPPDTGDPYLWADFAELRTLVHPDRCYSRGDLVGLAKRVEATAANRRFDPETRWRDLISFAAVRRREFGDDTYPFAVSADQDTLELRAAPSTPQQHSYLHLLMASLLRHIDAVRERNELARYFEGLSLEVFRHLMPQGAEVHATGAGRGAGARYRGTLLAKMTAMAKDIRAGVNFQARDFKRNDNGDGGIDLVAWHPMADARKGIPAALAQCGCSKEDWRFKQLETSHTKLGWKMPIMHPWASYYFLPLDFRHADGGWANEGDLGGAIIVDRLRLLRIADTHGLHALAPRWALLRTVLNTKYA